MRIAGIAAAFILFCMGASAEAQTISLAPSSSHYTLSHLTPQAGQIFSPLNDRVSFSFLVSSPDAEFTNSIHELVDGKPGPSLWTGPPRTAGSVPYEYVPFIVAPPIDLDQGKKYILLFNKVDASEGSQLFMIRHSDAAYDDGGVLIYEIPDGPSWVLQPDENYAMEATFSPSPLPATIPTLSEWAMILLGVALAGGAALVIQRRRMA